MSAARVVAGCLLLTTLAVSSPAEAAEPTTKETATPISSPTTVHGEMIDRSPSQLPASDASNTAVARTCNSGSSIYSTRWWQFTPTTTTTVVARSQVSAWLGRSQSPITSGVALVSSSGSILDCNLQAGVTQSVAQTVPAGTSLYVVQFFTFSPGCEDFMPIICYDWSRQFALKPTDGVRPSNDDWQAAKPIGALPYADSVDTTMATTQPADRDGGPAADCEFSPGGGYVDMVRTVWWSYTPTATTSLVLTLDGVPVQRQPGTRLIITRLTGTGPDFSAYCTGNYPPVLTAGVTYLIQLGTPVPTYSYDDINAGAPATITVAAATVPAAPTGLNVTSDPAQGTATITWSPPAPDSGPPVTGYRVGRDGIDSGGGGPWSTTLLSSARSQTFTLLSPGVTYTLSVQALNAVGAGPAASVRVPMAASTSAAAPPPALVVAPAVVPPPAPAAPVVVPAPVAAAPPPLNRTVRITKVQYNAPGRDSRRNLNGEYIRIKNTGSRSVVLTGWTIRDAAGSAYKFRATRLAAGASLTLFTGKGTNTSAKRFWGRTAHTWNNSGKESARLRDSLGRAVDSCSWTSRRAGYVTC